MSRETAQRYAREANEVLEQCDREGRDPSTAERTFVRERLDRAKAEAGLSVPNIGGMSNVQTDPRAMFTPMDPGQAFVQSKGYQRIRDASNRPQQWSTGAVSVGMEAKGTLLESAVGGGLGLVSVPQVLAGNVSKLFQPLTFENLVLAGQATSPTVRYAVEGTAVSGAAGVAEGGLKPESTLGFTTTDEPIKKVATVVPISDELLEDAPAVQQFIYGRLVLFVNLEAERQLLRGTSGGNEVQGLLTSRNVPVYAGGTAVGNRAVQIFKAMNGMRGSAFVEPDWVIMNPADWEAIRLLTDSAGQYLLGGPGGNSYGAPVQTAASGQVTGAADALWGKPVYVTAALGAGTAVVGTQAGAQVMNRGATSVEASNAHSDYFQRDLVAIRAERRLGLCVFRPNAYVECRIA